MMRWIALAVLVLAAAACTPAGSVDDLDYGTCVAVLKQVAKNPSRAQIPRVPGQDIGDGRVQYDWPRGGGLLLQNGYGALIDSTASCVLKDGALWVLVVDNRRFDSGEQFDLLALKAASYRARAAANANPSGG